MFAANWDFVKGSPNSDIVQFVHYRSARNVKCVSSRYGNKGLNEKCFLAVDARNKLGPLTKLHINKLNRARSGSQVLGEYLPLCFI